MKRNWLLICTCSLAVVAFGSDVGRAQRGGPGPGGPGLGPGPQDRIGFLGFAGGPGNKVVTGAPYCGQLTSDFVQTLGDGNQIHRQTVTNICRDSQGRTYRQMNLPAVVSGSADAPRAVVISDPVAGVDYMLDSTHKTYRKFVVPTGKPPKPPAGPPPLFEGGRPNQGATTDLGFQTINGLSSKGTRFTRTIPAHSPLGNEQPLTVTTERWYSQDLSIDIQTQTTDPSRGNTSTSMGNINRSEPDPTLFQVPAGYTLQQGPGGPGGFGRRPRAQNNAQ
jgi:hypothetical protein